MVTANYKWLVQFTALTVEFLVAILGIELNILNRVWLGFANIFEAIFVDVEGPIINACSLLALVAGCKDWFKFGESSEFILNFGV
jgi:hypothetical protein